MHRPLGFFAASLSLLLAGCAAVDQRIAEHSAEFHALPPATRQAIRRGVIEPGYTVGMVTMALGPPSATSTDAAGRQAWLYPRDPVTAPNETIQSGFRRRIVYNPVKRGDEVIIEPIDTKAFPQLVPYTLRVTFEHDRVIAIDRIPR